MDSQTTASTTQASTPEKGAADVAWAGWWCDCLPLFLIFLLAFLSPWASRELANPDEGRYAAIPLEMVQRGDWVTPRLDGVKYFEKPPLVYWVEAAVIEMGGTSERMLRLPILLFAFAGCLVVYFGVRRAVGRDVAMIGSLVLATTVFYWVLAGLIILDLAVSVLITATLVCFIAGIAETRPKQRRAWFYGLYVSAALATLTKGLIGFLLPGAVMFFWLLVYNQWRRLRPLYLPTGVILFSAIAAPWHVLVASRNPGWAWFYFIHEHFERFTSATHDREEAWWYYLPIVIAGMIPWTGLLVPAVRRAFSRKTAEAGQRATAGFFVVWAVFLLLFFSASSSKLPPYILPAFAPMAVLIAWWLSTRDSRESRAWPWVWGSAAMIIAVLALALAAIAVVPSLIKGVELEDLRLTLAAGAVALLAGSVIIAGLMKRRNRSVIWATAAFSVFFLNFVGATIVPRLDYVGTKKFAKLYNQVGTPTDRVYQYGNIFQDFVYYTGRTVGTVDAETELEVDLDDQARQSGRFIDGAALRKQWTEPRRIWVMLRKSKLPMLEAAGLTRYHVCMETARLILLSNQPLSPHEVTGTN